MEKRLKRWLSALASVAMLSGCSSAQVPSGNVAILSPLSEQRQPFGAGLRPQVSHSALLYISNFHRHSVDIYSYPNLKRVATLIPSGSVTSLCSDRSGNVWVGTSIDGTGTLTEYAHGGDKPIATLSLPDAVALDCDVDRSGDLAVAEAVNSVSVYQNERGTPQTFRDESMGEIYALTYDTRGNLFIYGTQRESFNYPLLGELPTGGSAFSNQEFDEKIQMPTFARWHGKNILLGGVTKRIKGTWTETVWTVAVSTSGLKIVNAKTFDAPAKHRGIGQSGLLQGDTLIQQDYSGNTIWLFSYTAGGEPSKMLRNSRGSHLTALTISE